MTINFARVDSLKEGFHGSGHVSKSKLYFCSLLINVIALKPHPDVI